MAQNVTLYNLLISCPGDIKEEVTLIEAAVDEFNELYAETLGITIKTRHWSKSSYAQSGGKPQALLNEQFVNKCDAAVAIFGTRYGSPTDEFGSGTEEEIEIMLQSGKQVFMYFSDKPIPPSKINGDNRNLRIIIAWLDMFRKIFDMTYRNMNSSKYFENIIADFMRYSIWVIVSSKKNKKIIKSAYYGNSDYVYFEGHEYTHTIRYYFIDKYIRSDYLDEVDLVRTSRSIEARCEREKLYNKEQVQSTGVAYSELKNWRYMEDDNIRESIQKMILELKEDKYAYPAYSNIIELLLFFNKLGLYKGDVYEVQKIMLSLVEKDMHVQDESRMPISFSDEDEKHKYLEMYKPIAESRKMRNEVLDKGEIEEEKVYDNADAFLQHCHKREDYYCTRKSFMEYIDIEKVIKLINSSDLEGIYKIADAFNVIYYMGNVKDFYMNDIEGLQLLAERLNNQEDVIAESITRKYAIEYLLSQINKTLIGLGVGGEND